MQITILGSGGFLPTPVPACFCRICTHAREVGEPDTRRGPSIFLNDDAILVDTPEDISASVNACGIERIQAILYTHWHPDHTLGFRIVEALRDLEFSEKKQDPLAIYIPTIDWENVKKIIPALWYFETKGLITIHQLSSEGVTIGKTTIKPIRLSETTFSAFDVTRENKRALLCPDHCKHLPQREELQNPDLLILNFGYLEKNLKNEIDLSSEHRIRSLTSLEDNLNHIDFFTPKQTVLMHIEERWNRTHHELLKLVSDQKNVIIATDGMKVDIE